MPSKTIRVDYLARVEGEGALYLRIRNDRVTDVQLKIFEPPRFFEAFLRGREYTEAPDITARICGICPVAYQMSACHAMENALGIELEGPLRDLRRLIYCGEWIESHSLHVYMLHAPDFLGYQDAVSMARDYPETVRDGLQLKKAGNEIVRVIGGREIHPVNVRVGGFYRVPTRSELEPLAEELRRAREIALATVRWTAGLTMPDFETDYTLVSLRHPTEYPFNQGNIVGNRGLDISVGSYDDHFLETHVARSNALHSVLDGQGAYLAGPLARFNLNFDRLSPLAREAAYDAGLNGTCLNPFRSIVIRSVEILYACDEALRIIEDYRRPDQPWVEPEPRAGTGYGCTEAPRGLLYHRYTLDEQGLIQDARIVPPTSQNQKQIEDDLRAYVSERVHLPKDELTWQCEQLIRNYDPCISCATHFLDLTLDRD
jgi:coenzyme F420-reducing hydrogenase alpha subunit